MVILAVTSDQHTNSTIGLCPSEGVRLDEGGTYQPSKAQIWLWDCWIDFHRQVAALRKKHKCKLVYVMNGDFFDGDHHSTTQIITRNVESQAYIAHRVASIPRDLKADEYHVVRGTTVHVKEGGASEEALGKHLNAVRDHETECWSSWDRRLMIYGKEFDFQHHTSVGGLPWTVPGGVARLAFRHWTERHLAGLKPADVIIRSHKHVHSDSYDNYPTRAIVTPAWQLKTSFAHAVAPESIADLGGLVIQVTPDGQYEVQKILYHPSLPTPRLVA